MSDVMGMKEVLNRPQLSNAEIDALAAENTEESRQRLVEAHLRMALYEAGRAEVMNGLLSLEELQSEAFMALVEGVADFDPGLGMYVNLFLQQRVRWALYKAVRTRARADSPCVSWEAFSSTMVSGAESTEYQRIELSRALGQLPPKDRDVVNLVVFQGAQKASETLGVSTSAVYQRWRRALQKLEENCSA